MAKITKLLLAALAISLSLSTAETIPSITESQSQSTRSSSTHLKDPEKLHDLIANFIFAMKGFILGFQQGLLNNERIRLSDQCFGTDEVNENLVFLS